MTEKETFLWCRGSCCPLTSHSSDLQIIHHSPDSSSTSHLFPSFCEHLDVFKSLPSQTPASAPLTLSPFSYHSVSLPCFRAQTRELLLYSSVSIHSSMAAMQAARHLTHCNCAKITNDCFSLIQKCILSPWYCDTCGRNSSFLNF